MPKFSQGDILLVPLPFTDLTASKKRPVLVLSKLDYNNTTDDLIVAAITSNIDNKPHAIKFTPSDMADGVLAVDSCVRADKIYTLSQSIVIKRYGKVNYEIVESVKTAILNIIDET